MRKDGKAGECRGRGGGWEKVRNGGERLSEGGRRLEKGAEICGKMGNGGEK